LREEDDVDDAYATRKRNDLLKLRALQSKIPKVLEIMRVNGDPPYSITCRIHIPTAKDAEYPRIQQAVSEVEIQLPERYPQQKPSVSLKSPIWNPNVFPSGQWCYGDWKVTEFLDLFVTRLMRVLALDPAIINPRSAANPGAAQWYTRLLAQHPEVFPTVSVPDLLVEVQAPKIAWRNIS
jgi:ubiquitin-protein ligase